MIPSIASIQVCGPNDAGVFGWRVTSRLSDDTRYLSNGQIRCAHTLAGRWPTEPIADDGTLTEGNLWGICRVGDQWWARTLHHLRPGQTAKEYPVTDWGDDRVPLPIPRTHVIQPGDLVGLFVSTRARYGTNPARERSGIVWLTLDGPIEAREEVFLPPDPGSPPVPPADLAPVLERLDRLVGLVTDVVAQQAVQVSQGEALADAVARIRTDLALPLPRKFRW